MLGKLVDEAFGLAGNVVDLACQGVVEAIGLAAEGVSKGIEFGADQVDKKIRNGAEFVDHALHSAVSLENKFTAQDVKTAVGLASNLDHLDPTDVDPPHCSGGQ